MKRIEIILLIAFIVVCALIGRVPMFRTLSWIMVAVLSITYLIKSFSFYLVKDHKVFALATGWFMGLIVLITALEANDMGSEMYLAALLICGLVWTGVLLILQSREKDRDVRSSFNALLFKTYLAFCIPVVFLL
jgi:hypothetical protein